MNETVVDSASVGTNKGGTDIEVTEKESRDMVDCLSNEGDNGSNGVEGTVGVDLSKTNGEIGLDEVESFPILNESINRVSDVNQESNNYDMNKPDNQNDNDLNKSSFFKIVKPTLINQRNKLSLISTGIKDGRDVVMFKEELVKEGMENVLEAGPWMVNNKPLLIQRWDPTVCIDKKEPEKIPIWVKLVKLPLEAWTTKGISSIISNLGKPLIMDKVTTQMCNEGTDSIGYARVLVEVSAKDELKDRIELCYKDKNKVTIKTKYAGVEYAWKPKVGSNSDKVQDKEGFVQVKKNKENKKRGNENIGDRMQGNQKRKHAPNKEKEWSVPKNVIEDIRKSANKYSILEDQREDDILGGITLAEKGIVDKHVKEKTQPSLITTKDWSHDTVNYFKDQWEKHKGGKGIE
ncbi:RNA-directed DNA polymerase, eukaryota, reverse transcriptase zinc-binding domain protein [Tanacetum coccineum]|uniref:RNA-directed DNA polymerase, eukaryota, reverse transcriptase zinc-binding domain protein n=1 Tax=Tanacetum coccineum TaxID=301880 RepID=A0ABQ5GYE2_9ASTR